MESDEVGDMEENYIIQGFQIYGKIKDFMLFI